MALKRDVKYPGRFEAASTEHPQGKFKNRTSPTSQDGSYLEQQWLNDWDGFFGSLLSENDIEPDEDVDEVGSSQYFDALLQLREVSPINNDWNGYLDPDHTVPIEIGDTSAGTRVFDLDEEIAPNIYSGAASNSITFADDGWIFTQPIYKLYTFTAAQMAGIDVTEVPVFLKDQTGASYFVKHDGSTVNVTKPNATTLKVEITSGIFAGLGITKLWRLFPTEGVGYVVELEPSVASGTTTLNYSDINDVKLNATGDVNNQKISIDHYSVTFACRLSLYRDTSSDDVLLAGTDWNDNGSINNNLICFGPNGEAWVIRGKNVFAPRLGMTNEIGLTAAFDYVSAQKSTVTGFNDYLLSSNGEVGLGGLEITIENNPAQIPDTMNGVALRHGMIVADPAYTGDTLVDGTSTFDWITSIIVEDVTFSGSHITGCVDMQRGNNWRFFNCRFHAYATFAIRNQPPGTSNSITDCNFYEYHYGEPGFDNPTNFSGTAIENLTSDLIVKGGFIGYGLHGLHTTGGNTQISGMHLYGLTGWAINDESSYNTYHDVILDEPCKVRFGGNTPGYGVDLSGIKFVWQTPKSGAMIYFEPNSSVELSGFMCTGGKFLTDGYAGNVVLNLTSIVFGESDVSSPSAYFTESMIGSTIVGNAGGTARIIGYTSSTSVHVYIVEAFPAASIAAGDWLHKVTPFYANPLSFGTNPKQININGNFYRSDTVQPMSSEPIKEQYISNQENFEIEFGRWLLIPKVSYAWITQVEGTTNINQSMKALYISGTKVAVDFDSAFTGNVIVKAIMDPGDI